MGHDLPMEKVPFAFSRALCSLTRPVFRTDIMIMRAFLFEGGALGGGGDWGKEPSSWTRICVIYDSWTATSQRSCILCHSSQQHYLRWPWSSVLAKQLSVILLRSSSKRSARDMPDGAGLALLVEGGPLELAAEGRPGGARGSPDPLG